MVHYLNLLVWLNMKQITAWWTPRHLCVDWQVERSTEVCCVISQFRTLDFLLKTLRGENTWLRQRFYFPALFFAHYSTKNTAEQTICNCSRDVRLCRQQKSWVYFVLYLRIWVDLFILNSAYWVTLPASSCFNKYLAILFCLCVPQVPASIILFFLVAPESNVEYVRRRGRRTIIMQLGHKRHNYLSFLNESTTSKSLSVYEFFILGVVVMEIWTQNADSETGYNKQKPNFIMWGSKSR